MDGHTDERMEDGWLSGQMEGRKKGWRENRR
jgi:hypothetical protein